MHNQKPILVEDALLMVGVDILLKVDIVLNQASLPNYIPTVGRIFDRDELIMISNE